MYEPNRQLDGEFDDDGLGCARGVLSALMIMGAAIAVGSMCFVVYRTWAPVLLG